MLPNRELALLQILNDNEKKRAIDKWRCVHSAVEMPARRGSQDHATCTGPTSSCLLSDSPTHVQTCTVYTHQINPNHTDLLLHASQSSVAPT